MNKLQPYTTYKASGIAWLGDIPEHWQQTQLNKIFQDNKIKNENLQENNLLTLSYGKIKRKDINSANGLLPASFSNYQIIEKGDIVLRMLDLQNDKTSLRVGFVNEKGIITSAYIGLKLKNDYSSKYFYELLNHLDLIKHFYNGGGGVRQSISFSEIGKERIALPPISEQIAIANFLDYKTAQIDRFIRKKKQLIKLLNEQKAAIINDAVTKGLNPKVKTKPSGIEWLGDIPAHWEVKKLKYSVCLNQHIIFDNEESKANKIALENIESKSGRILELTENAFEGVGTIFKKGDVLFGKLRPYLAKVVSPNFEGSCVNEILVLTPNNEIWQAEFLKFRMLSSEFIKIVDDSTFGSKMPRASWDFIGGLKISSPPLPEQAAIVAHIEAETALINNAIATIEKEIALVQEYRTALIAEAVTGKIDVRGYEIPQTEEAEDDEETDTAAEDELDDDNDE